MFTSEQYLIAWLYYLAGVLVLSVGWWFVLRKIKRREPRQLLTLTVPAFLLIPWFTTSDASYLSPAWLMAVFEAVFEGPASFWRAGFPLLVGIACVLAIATVSHIVIAIRLHKVKTRAV